SLPYIISAVSVTALIGGFQSTKLFEANRNLSLGSLTRIELTAQLAGLLSMLGWVSVDRSVWALVAGNISGALAMTLISHAWLPGVANRWQWDGSALREIIHFGKWIFLSSILGFLAMNGDRLLLGGLVNANILGVYVIAFLIFSSVDEVMSKIIIDVSFPAL